MTRFKLFRSAVCAALYLFGMSTASAAPIMTGSVTFDTTSSLYSYEYVVTGVDPGRKVTGIYWVMIDDPNATWPSYLPVSWSTPYFWSFQVGWGSPWGGVWMSNTGDNDGIHTFPISPDWGTLLTGQSRTFSFTTGYGPRTGTYYLVENANGSEVNYNFLAGTTVLPNFDGTLVESPNSTHFNYPPDYPESTTTPEPATLALLALGLAGLGFGRRRKQSVAV